MVSSGLRDAYRDAFAGRRLAWASPAVAMVGSFIAFYGLGLVVTSGSLRSDLPVVLLAVGLGLGGLLIGLGLGWSQPVNMEAVPASAARRSGIVGYLLLTAGLVLAIAPIIPRGSGAVRVLVDRWTGVTAAGSLAAHFEDTIANTEDGPYLLTGAA